MQNSRDALGDDEHRGIARLVLQRMAQGGIGLKVQGLGTHDELMETCEVYRAIAESQMKGGE